MTSARCLARWLTLAALACLLAVGLWPDPVCRACGAEVMTSGLLDYPAPGQVVACPVLFLDGR